MADLEALMEDVQALWDAGRRTEALQRQAQAARLFPRIPAAHVVAMEALLHLDRVPEAREVLQRGRLLMTARVHPEVRKALEKFAVELAAQPRPATTAATRTTPKEKRPAAAVPRTELVTPVLPSMRRSTPQPDEASPARVELVFRPLCIAGELRVSSTPALALDDYRLRLDAQAVARLGSF